MRPRPPIPRRYWLILPFAMAIFACAGYLIGGLLGWDPWAAAFGAALAPATSDFQRWWRGKRLL